MYSGPPIKLAKSPFHDLHTLAQHIQALKQSGNCVVFTNGCFDLLHVGHVHILEQARALGDYLIVGINSDTSVRKLKGTTRPIIPETDRGIMLNALKSVDAVVCFDDDTPVPILKILQPSIHAKGGDYQPQDLPEYPVVTGYGGRVHCLGFIPGKSTSAIIQRITGITRPD